MLINNELINNYNFNNNQNYILTNKDHKLIKRLIEIIGWTKWDAHYYYKYQNWDYYRNELDVNQIWIINYNNFKKENSIVKYIWIFIILVIIFIWIFLIVNNFEDINNFQNNDSLMIYLITIWTIIISGIIFLFIALIRWVINKLLLKRKYKFLSYDYQKNKVIIYRYK